MEKFAHLVAVDEQRRRLSILESLNQASELYIPTLIFRLIFLMQIAKLMRVFYDCLEKI
jgi:hypothetical protein